VLCLQSKVAAHFREHLRNPDERQEDDRLPVPVFPQHFSDLREIRQHGMSKVVGTVVAGRCPHAPQVELQRHSLHPDRGEPSLIDQIKEGDFACDVLEVPAEVAPVTPVGGGRDAEYLGVSIKLPQDPEIGVRQRMVRLIDDDQPEVILWPPAPARFPHERLDGPDHDRCIR
jgi:hypothetical protein